MSLFLTNFNYDVIATLYMECWHFIWYGWLDFFECGVIYKEFPERVIVNPPPPLGKIIVKKYLGRTRVKLYISNYRAAIYVAV